MQEEVDMETVLAVLILFAARLVAPFVLMLFIGMLVQHQLKATHGVK